MSLTSKRLKRDLVPLLALSLSLVFVTFATPAVSSAAPSLPYVGQVLSGTCYIGDCWRVGSESYFHCSWSDGNFSGTWTLGCLNHTAAEPMPQWAPYTATVTNYNKKNGMTTYYIVITPAYATDGSTYQGGMLVGYQRVGGNVTVQRPYITGSLSVHKTVAPVEDEPMEVDLSGIRFQVIDTDDGQSAGTLELDEEGNGQLEGIPLGTYKLQEIPESLPDLIQSYSFSSGTGSDTCGTFTITPQETQISLEVENHVKRHVEVLKVDEDHEDLPLPDTLFSLQRSTGADWTEVFQVETDSQGVADLGLLPYGSYRLVEIRPNPLYQEPGEYGGEPLEFQLDASSPLALFQMVGNRAIHLSCFIDKSTIALTSAAFRTRHDDQALKVDNVGSERYYYRLSFGSSSDVRADEFTVVDELVAAREHKVVLDHLWSPVVQGDSDGSMNVWFKTNLTDAETTYSSANASASNPPNPNTTQGMRVTDTTGWRLLAEHVPADSPSSWGQEDFCLAEGEFITALMYEYGSVEVGFATISPVTYSVFCPGALEPGVNLDNQAHCSIYRNTFFDEEGDPELVLHDHASDTTRTRVIGTFLTNASSWEGEDEYGRRIQGGLVDTGDTASVPLLSLLGAFLALGATLTLTAYHLQRKRERTVG